MRVSIRVNILMNSRMNDNIKVRMNIRMRAHVYEVYALAELLGLCCAIVFRLIQHINIWMSLWENVQWVVML